MRLETLAGLADEVAGGVDLVLGEGVMGLFDGAADGRGSTADLASLFDLPVVLVVDARGMAASAAALVEGFTRHRDDVEVAGVLFNRVASAEHEALLRRACDDRFAQPVLACLPSDPRLELPARHLGLVQAAELPDLEGFLERAADLVGERTDLDRLMRLARPFGLGLYGPPARPLRPLGQRIAVADDVAFGFAYPATLAGWRSAGAEVLRFRPARRRGAGPVRGRGLPAGRLSGAARRTPRGRAAASSTACARRRRAARSSMASAAASWRSAGRSPTAPARRTRWPACCRSRPASPSLGCSSATAA